MSNYHQQFNANGNIRFSPKLYNKIITPCHLFKVVKYKDHMSLPYNNFDNLLHHKEIIDNIPIIDSQSQNNTITNLENSSKQIYKWEIDKNRRRRNIDKSIVESIRNLSPACKDTIT